LELIPYSPDLAEKLSESFNSMMQGVPHCYTTSPETWISFLTPLADSGIDSESFFFNGIVSQELVLVWDHGEIIGLCHSIVEVKCSKESQTTGTVAFISYRRGRRDAGQLLVEASERYLRSQEVDIVQVFPGAYRYPFYHVETAYLSSKLDHVQALLGLNGYKSHRGLGFLERRNFVPSIPPRKKCYGEIVRETSVSKDERWHIRLRVVANGRTLGTCESGPLEFYGSLSPKGEWVFIRWIEVVEDLRGNKLGLYILERMLEEMGERGYRHAVIGVDQGNDRALSMYSNYGFQMSDWTYAFVKNFD
jgi:predicted GNAT family N-acyltransferase